MLVDPPSDLVERRYREAGSPEGAGYDGLEQWLKARAEQRAFLIHRFYDLRHNTATYLLAAGIDPRIVMAIMGWSQVTMLARYQHVLDSMLDDAARRLESVFSPAGRTVSVGV